MVHFGRLEGQETIRHIVHPRPVHTTHPGWGSQDADRFRDLFLRHYEIVRQSELIGVLSSIGDPDR